MKLRSDGHYHFRLQGMILMLLEAADATYVEALCVPLFAVAGSSKVSSSSSTSSEMLRCPCQLDGRQRSRHRRRSCRRYFVHHVRWMANSHLRECFCCSWRCRRLGLYVFRTLVARTYVKSLAMVVDLIGSLIYRKLSRRRHGSP
jgi:hypothetical protein